ncbi:hypothetical protein ASG29_06485 [Sphingomonas sp. Leaf412]|uniref:hypothetical protein n=1 Tax=Sphingomonas sp. Leaf412 TaxID=1736370 RepID=UPI0006FA675A|nr:hypothetical protein [Sphingomonas sp. Leaf412]KQT33654.1 hypothetical protein ASG29_06485 [Sphingomonas sp. Leaf412]
MATSVASAPQPAIATPRDQRPRAQTRRATGIAHNPRDINDVAALVIRYNVLRDALVAAFGTPDKGTEAMGARVKALLGLGLRRHAGPAPGRGRGHRNGLPDALDVALALTLQRAFVPPAAAAALLTGNRPTLDALWAAAARGERAEVTVAIDALSHTGRDGMRSGRFSEDPVGTLTLTGRQDARNAGGSLPPPQVTIDLTAIYDVTTGSLRRAGLPHADLSRAEHRLAETPSHQVP